MSKVHDYGTVRDEQLRTLAHIGLFSGSVPKQPNEAARLVDPYDTRRSPEIRVRSYLHVNCSVCHVEAGGGNAKMELALTTALERMNILSARPQHDTFGIDNAMLIAPGDPDRSILYQRLLRRGRGQMPPLVSTVADQRAIALFKKWISGLKSEQKFVRDWKMEDLIPSLEQLKEGRSLESGRNAFRQIGCGQCHRFAGEGGSVGPDLTGVARRLSRVELLESILLPSKVIAEGYATTEIELKSGQALAGRIDREDDETVFVRPLSATEAPFSLRKADIRNRSLSKISNMPAGIANTLEREQILDLLAYLIADGDPADHAFEHQAVPAAK